MMFFLFVSLVLLIIAPLKFKMTINEDMLLLKLFNVPIFIKKDEDYYYLIANLIKKNKKRNRVRKLNIKKIINSFNFTLIDISLKSINNDYPRILLIQTIFRQIINIYDNYKKKNVKEIKYNLKISELNSFKIDVYFDVIIGKIFIYLFKKRS